MWINNKKKIIIPKITPLKIKINYPLLWIKTTSTQIQLIINKNKSKIIIKKVKTIAEEIAQIWRQQTIKKIKKQNNS